MRSAKTLLLGQPHHPPAVLVAPVHHLFTEELPWLKGKPSMT